MAQVGWVFLDDFGGRHRVGLYHGERMGHLLFQGDSRILHVDFSAKESRTYSFSLEDELCAVSVVHGKQPYWSATSQSSRLSPLNIKSLRDLPKTQPYCYKHKILSGF